MNENEYMMWLSRSLHQNGRKIYHILGHFGCAAEVYRASESMITSVGGISQKDIKSLAEGKTLLKDWIEETEKSGVSYVCINDKSYPYFLGKMNEPPVVIYYKGSLPAEEDICIGMIGARRCSEYGAQSAYSLSKALAKEGFVIVSGMARGIDSMSHKGALAGGGKTVAVLGFGHNHCYPAENRSLMEKISKNGCLISEYPPDTAPMDYMFVQRNRIIAGLCEGLIVLEAAKKSGTLSTVDFALENGRTVMAVPSNITSRTGEGTNELIKQGCPMVTCAEDVCFEFGRIKKEKTEENIEALTEDFSEEEKKVYQCIGKEPVGIEYIKNKSGMSYQDVQYILAVLEINGAVNKLPGERYIRAV